MLLGVRKEWNALSPRIGESTMLGCSGVATTLLDQSWENFYGILEPTQLEAQSKWLHRNAG